jgi:hypothetical protein
VIGGKSSKQDSVNTNLLAISDTLKNSVMSQLKPMHEAAGMRISS